jgi:hypothetical protein
LSKIAVLAGFSTDFNAYFCSRETPAIFEPYHAAAAIGGMISGNYGV